MSRALCSTYTLPEHNAERYRYRTGYIHITNKLTWSKHTKTVMKRAQQNLFPIRRLKRFGMGPQILKKFYKF